MTTNREIPFAFDVASFKNALADMQNSIDEKQGKVIQIKAGKSDVGEPDDDIGIIVVNESV